MKRQDIIIAGDSPAQNFTLTRLDFGPDDAALPKIFLQAGLHADEQPGMMVLHHLIGLLKQAEDQAALKARFVLFPMCNPIGMAQIGLQYHLGRYNLPTGLNFNRQWPDLFALLADDGGLERLALDLDASDCDANTAAIRAAVKAALDGMTPVTAIDRQRHVVAKAAFDCDMVLDLHCDDLALNHIFIVPQLMPDYQDLADWMGAAATLTAEDSGGGSFDEVWPGLWIKLARHFPDHAIAPPPLAATLEYRGRPDVDDSLNRIDAQNLFAFLQGRGLIAGAAERKPASAPAALPLTATEIVTVRRPGLLAYHVNLGDQVKTGDVIADLISLDGPDAFEGREPIKAGTDGLILSLRCQKYICPGDSVAKIVGTEPLVGRSGYLLEM